MSFSSFASCSKDSSRDVASNVRASVDQLVLGIKIQTSSSFITCWDDLNLGQVRMKWLAS